MIGLYLKTITLFLLQSYHCLRQSTYVIGLLRVPRHVTQYKYCQTNTHRSELGWLPLTLILIREGDGLMLRYKSRIQGWQQMIAEGRVGKFNKMFKTQPWALKQLTCVPCHHCHWRFYTVVDEFINPCTNEGGTNLAARTVQQSTGGQRGCMKPHMHNSKPAVWASVARCSFDGNALALCLTCLECFPVGLVDQ